MVATKKRSVIGSADYDELKWAIHFNRSHMVEAIVYEVLYAAIIVLFAVYVWFIWHADKPILIRVFGVFICLGMVATSAVASVQWSKKWLELARHDRELGGKMVRLLKGELGES